MIKIFIATNGLCATKFILSLQHCDVEFYGMVTREDLLANYTYIPHLKQYRIVESGNSEVNYSNLDLICKLTKEFFCDYVFAGYGHASENPMLSKKLGTKFIGPSYVSMSFLTDKLISTVIASLLNIPITKFYTNCDLSLISDEFHRVKTHFANNNLLTLPELTIFDGDLKLIEYTNCQSFPEIQRFPVYLKITNSGGGKGIFLINDNFELKEKLTLARISNKKSKIKFEKDEVLQANSNQYDPLYFLTEVIEDARHFEVQVLADKYKNINILGGRECSNQRRRQKLIETSIDFDDEFTENIFESMCNASIKIISCVGYYGLATVEFLFSKGNFYFLEVNCRIQVEHSITELIYGLNLPNLLYKVANNEIINVKIQEKYKFVMGVRITAETEEFLPSSGNVIVENNTFNCFTYFSTFKGTINDLSDSHFGYIFSFSDSKEKMIKNILTGIKNLNIIGISTPLKKIYNFIKDRRYNKSVFELEKYFYKEENTNIFIIFACIIYFDRNKKKKEIQFFFDNKIFSLTIYDLNDKLLLISKESFTIISYIFINNKIILFFDDKTEFIEYQKENDCFRYKNYMFFEDFNVKKSEISGKIIQIKENKVTIESMKIRHIIDLPEQGILLVKENDMIKCGDDFYKINDSFEHQNIIFDSPKGFDFLEEAIQNKDVPVSFINELTCDINYYLINNKNPELVGYFIEKLFMSDFLFDNLIVFILNFPKESLIDYKNKLITLFKEKKLFDGFSDSFKVELIKSFLLKRNVYFEISDLNINSNPDILLYLKNYNLFNENIIEEEFNEKNYKNILLFFENILLISNKLIKLLNIKEIKVKIKRFCYCVINDQLIQSKLVHDNKVLSYKVNFKERNNKNNQLSKHDFIDLIAFYFREIHEPIEITEMFLERKENKTPKLSMIDKIIKQIKSKKVDFKLSTSKTEEIGMKGYLVKVRGIIIIFIINNKNHKNGSFGIKEDILFYLLSKLARINKFPKVFISNNSGARIGVVNELFNEIVLKNDQLYINTEKIEALDQQNNLKHGLSQESKKNSIVCVSNNYLSIDNKILSIYGNEDTGPENLSFCTLTARESIKCYNNTLTLSYIHNMSVGIGAYLSKLCYRIIQKENTCIILTGYRALNKIFKEEVYKNNLELGGDSIYKKNSMIDLFVHDDLAGIEEIFFLCEIFYKSRRRSQRIKNMPVIEKTMKIEEYFVRDWNENHNELEIIEQLLDRFKEYGSNYGPAVRIIRGFYKDTALGVISAINTILCQETCEKISDAIEKFNKEGLDMLIIANWAGFSSTKEELQKNIISFGAMIIDKLVNFKQRILVYLPPHSLLKGGSYVCFDKRINPNLKMYVHPTARISILDPEGVAEVKLKNVNRKEVMFCELHDSAYRMVKNKIVDDILTVNELPNIVERMLLSNDW